MKKLTALLLALVMVLAMNASALAAGELGGAADSTSNIDTFNINVTLAKLASVNNPDETVTFTIEPADAGDVANPYQVGPADGLKFANTGDDTASFAKNLTAASTTATITLTTDADEFSAPGIYRYKITETVNKTDLGFAAADGTEKYIDVYVKLVGGNKTVYAVMMGASLDGTSKTLSEKDADFNISYTTDPGSNPDDPGDDTPESYDVQITKASGNGGAEDPNQDFTFTLTVNALAAANGVKIPVDVSALTITGQQDEIVLSDENKDYTYTVRLGDSFTLKGLPKTLVLKVVETIAGVGGYDVTWSVNDKMESTSGNAAKDTGFAQGTVKGTGGIMTITNTRTTISPTGVVLRMAPYAIMLGAGVVLFIILKSRKNKAVEEA